MMADTQEIDPTWYNVICVECGTPISLQDQGFIGSEGVFCDKCWGEKFGEIQRVDVIDMN
jgi:hypothetical protein